MMSVTTHNLKIIAADVISEGRYCWESTCFILSKHCPMFGFQSHLLPVLFQLYEWIICCSRLIIIPSLFAKLLQYEVKNDLRRMNSWHLVYDCHRYIELFACKAARITHNDYTIYFIYIVSTKISDKLFKLNGM